MKADLSETVRRALVKAGLTEGSVFNGKIQDITGNSVKILLSGGDTLLATLENGTGFNIGEKVNFMVKSNDGVKILLQPVETAAESRLSQSLINSLEQLGLNINDRNIAMVKEMMAYKMPLDSSSVSDMERLVNLYPNGKVEDIVTLHSHGIPVTGENLDQLASYQSYQHKMTENIDNVAKELMQLSESRPELVKSIIGDIMKNISGVFFKEDNAFANDNANTVNNTSNNDNISAEILTDTQSNTNAGKKETVTINTVMQEVSGDKASENQNNTTVQNNVSDGPARTANTQLSSEDGTVVLRQGKNETDNINKQNSPIQTDEKNIINKSNISQQAENISSSNFNETDKLQRQLREAIKELKGRWLLNEDFLAGKSGEEIKAAINEKLKSIYADSWRLMDILKNNGMEKTDAYKAAENMKNNIQFMNDFNHVAGYVQVPYRTQSGEANTELFVYNRNKNKSLIDGPITAFLHLDMEHLGATDVRVTMDISGKVSAKFSLEDTMSQNIVEEHLHELKKRLEQQGYEVELSSEVIENEETESPFEHILKIDKPRSEVKRYGFDIRL